MNKGICKIKGCINEGKYCRIHPAGFLAPVKPIAARSEKLAKVMKKDYVPQVKEMVSAGTKCSIKSPVCTRIAQGFHHPKGRIGENLLKEKIPACNPCNIWVEKNVPWAIANGVIKSRHSNYKRQPKI